MNNNFSITSLSLTNIKASPLFNAAQRSLECKLSFSKIETKNSFSSFFFSLNSRFDLNIQKSSFTNYLSSAIKQSSEIYAYLNSDQRFTIYKRVNTKMTDCSFRKCIANGTGIDGHGGAIFVFYSIYSMFSLTLERINFDKCEARSCGGSIFVFNSKFESDILCFTNSYSIQNKIFFVQAKEMHINSTFAGNNTKNTKKYPTKNAMSVSGDLILMKELNISSSKATFGASFISINRYKLIELQKSIFRNCSSEFGIYSHALNDATSVIHSTLFVESRFSSQQVVSLDTPISFVNCGFLFQPMQIATLEKRPLVTIKISLFFGHKEEWENNFTNIVIESPKFVSVDINSLLTLDLPVVEVMCKIHEDKFSRTVDPNRMEFSINDVLNFSITYLPVILAVFASFTCLLFSYRNKGKEGQLPTALKR